MVVGATVPRLPRSKRTGEVLEDKRKSGKARPWQRYKQESLDIAEGYGILGKDRLSEHIARCGSYLKFDECARGHRKLKGADFCRSRLCSMCASRRALLIATQVHAVSHAAVQRDPGLRFIFLTLTVPNVEGAWISEIVTALYLAFQRACRTRAVRDINVGYFRALEITHSKRLGNFHPHLHVLIAVPQQFFDKRHRLYINHQQWLDLWRRAMRDERITQVHVCKVRAKRTGDDPIASAAAEVAKYTVKGKTLIQGTPQETAVVLGQVHAGLHGRRLVQFGRCFSKIKKELKLIDAERASSKDLVAVGYDPGCVCSVCQLPLFEHVYHWIGGRRGDYVG
jgi:plasmid rolling circle replication initiator protein Rep